MKCTCGNFAFKNIRSSQFLDVSFLPAEIDEHLVMFDRWNIQVLDLQAGSIRMDTTGIGSEIFQRNLQGKGKKFSVLKADQ